MNMDSCYRVIISTSSLNIENWTDIYRFIDSIFTDDKEENKIDALFNLKERCVKVNYASKSDTKLESHQFYGDAYQLYGNEVTDEVLNIFGKNTCFSILYHKNDDTEEFTGFAPFVFFLRRFKDEKNKRSLVSLGIGTDGIKNQSIVDSFYYKCSNFFLLYDIPEPVLGEKTIYFFSPTAKIKTRVLAGTGKDTDYQGDPNRRFLPLLTITEENYHSIFTSSEPIVTKKSKEYTEVNESLNKIKNKFKNDIFKSQQSKLDLIVNYKDSLFGQWLINGYFYSYKPNELRDMSLDEIKGIIQTLQIYKNSIFELVQNIIFHGGKSGLFYCVFDKKENISTYYQNYLPDFKNEDSKVNRFMRVGIYDYQESDFVDSFIKREWKTLAKSEEDPYSNLSLRDFFDPKSISTIGISRLDMRYAAHLGIKSFVKTVFNHNGYFSVESNEVVNDYNLKKRLTTIWDRDDDNFKSNSIDNFAPGTHYEIILPVLPTDNLSISAPTIQRDTILNFRRTLQKQLKSDKPIQVVNLDYGIISNINDTTSKVEQLATIAEIGNHIIESSGRNRNEIVVNLNGKDFDHKLVFKILAYMQLTADNGFKKIILINATNNFVILFSELINSTLLLENIGEDIPVWSNNHAIILMSEKLHVQIICGDNKEKIYALNQEFQKYYCYNSFPERIDEPFTFSNNNFEYSKSDLPREFILPYDILVKLSDGTTLFENYSLDLLKRKIISNDLGFLVNHENTYIGNKIIVINYYEADMMFQNSFFAERFAYLISKNLLKLKRTNGKDLVLIGYQHYSEYLLKAIKRIINDKSVHIAIANANDDYTKEKKAKEDVMSINVNNKETFSIGIDLSFNFDIDGNNSELRKKILESPEQFQFATIVPVGATLSTNDKIVALFKLWHKLQNTQKRESDNIDFIYNHCVIIVRDTISPEPTALEKEQQWKAIQLDQHLIRTDFQNATEIHYTIQIAKTTDDNPTDNNWLRRLNNNVSFPPNWQDEEYVNFTENSSINSQNLMGFPKVDSCGCDHKKELARLYELRNDIYKGHFDIFNSHHKYYFDTESFVRRNNNKFTEWLSDIKKREYAFNLKKFNILITPNAETESDFICAINDKIFDGNALIVYLDVKNWRNNIVHKLYFLKHMDRAKVSFHYVDHILLTGETYHRTKSYLYSIIDDYDKTKQGNQVEDNLRQDNHEKNKSTGKKQNNSFGIFDSVISLINRLPYTKGKEIMNDVNRRPDIITTENKNDVNPIPDDMEDTENKKDEIRFFAFINLYYPTSELDGRECELCKLQRYYDDLSKKTVLDSCKQVIKKNVDKLICKSRKELEQSRDNRDAQQTNRDFLRLVITHELYYRISQIAWNQANKAFSSTKEDVYAELEAIYCKLCNKEYTGNKDTKSNINDCIDEWFKLKFTEGHSDQKDLLEYHNQKLETDKKISFLKVISSPPLSKYIIIRQYAHSKLLTVLYEIIKDNNENENNENENIYDDLKIVKSILKSLSFLKSNALVRKNVIVEVWKILGKAQKHLGKDLLRINKCIDDCTKLIHSIEDKQQMFLKTGNFIPKLENQKKDANEHLDYLEREKKHLKDLITKGEIIKDFSRDFQFFIKNTIVEDDAKATFLGDLIRSGEEIVNFDTIQISKTKLYLKKDNTSQNDKNDLFVRFQDTMTYPNEPFRKEYTDFLVWLFYDNTTIIRKTLDNFTKELEKDSNLRSLFKDGEKLKDFENFKSNIDSGQETSIKQILSDKIKGEKTNEYYYSSFKPYLDHEEDFHLLDKLIYVTYAKLKLEDLIVNKHKKSIEADIKDLLKILSKIMGADGAFFTLKLDDSLYPMALFIDNKPKATWKYDEWLFNDFLTKKYINMGNSRYPIIPFYNVSKQRCGERRNQDLGAHSLNIFVIEDLHIQERATITFLYKEENTLIDNVITFRIDTQESGRLLLLLKNEISEYVINYLVKDKVFNLWTEKQKNFRKFEKIYIQSNHTFNSVYDEMEEFEKIDEKALGLTFKTWFFLTNETISFFYSNIERNRTNGIDALHCLSIGKNSVMSDTNTLGETFNKKFVYTLSCLLDGYWNQEDINKEEDDDNVFLKNMIFINNIDIHDFDKLSDKLIKVPTGINKHLLRTFIAQCLHNSLAIDSEGHGHRRWEEIKRINISISKTSITIQDSFICEISEIDTNELKNDVYSFKMKKNHIKSINCDEYSSTTLTTLQGVINYLNCSHDDYDENNKYYYRCEYGFDKNNNFRVTIKFNNNGKENFNH